MTNSKRMAFTRRVSLENQEQGWGPECYVMVTLASSGERNTVIDQSDKHENNSAASEQMRTQVTKHFVKGSGMVFNDADEFELGELNAGDVAEFPDDVLRDLWAAVNGFSLDPKAIEAAMASSSEQKPASAQPVNSASTTATTSSTETPQASPEQS